MCHRNHFISVLSREAVRELPHPRRGIIFIGISKLESKKNVLGSVLMPKFMMGWNAGFSFRKRDCSAVKFVLKFRSKISRGVRAAFSGPRRKFVGMTSHYQLQ
jgi:hypothetical protein